MSDKLARARHRKLDDGPDAAEDKLSRARHRRLPAAGDASAGAVRAAGAGVAGRGAERLGAHGRPSARKGAFAQGADVEEAAETEAVRFAGDFVHDAMIVSAKQPEFRDRGVSFEPLLGKVCGLL